MLFRLSIVVFTCLFSITNIFPGLLITDKSEKSVTKDFIEDLFNRGDMALADLEGKDVDLIYFLYIAKQVIQDEKSFNGPKKNELRAIIDNYLDGLTHSALIDSSSTTTTISSQQETLKRPRESDYIDVEEECQASCPKKVVLQKDNEILPRYLTKGYSVHQALCCQNEISNEDAQYILNNKLIRTGISVSGGGARAMAAACALSYALSMATTSAGAKLFDSFDYFAGLSGSTWFCLQCIGHMKSVVEMKKIIQKHFNGRPFFDNVQKRLFSVALGKSNLIDHYVELLHKHFFVSPEMSVSFESYKNLLDAGDPVALQYPYFLFPAFVQDGEKSSWFECSVHTVGLPHLNYTIDEKSFMPAHQLMSKSRLAGYAGLFGSAFAINSNNHLQLTKEYVGARLPERIRNTLSSGWNGFCNLFSSAKSISFPSSENLISSQKAFVNYRLFAPSVPNFIQEKYRSSLSECMKKDVVKLFDPGIEVNLPFYLLLKKNCNLIFILDVSDDAYKEWFGAFDAAANDARERGMKFPNFSHSQLVRQGLTVLHDEDDPEVPVVIYMNVWLKECGLLNLNADSFERMNNAVYGIVRENLSTITNAYGIAYKNILKMNKRG